MKKKIKKNPTFELETKQFPHVLCWMATKGLNINMRAGARTLGEYKSSAKTQAELSVREKRIRLATKCSNHTLAFVLSSVKFGVLLHCYC